LNTGIKHSISHPTQDNNLLLLGAIFDERKREMSKAMQRKNTLITVMAIFASALVTQDVAALVSFDFTKVADTSTLIPGGSGAFGSFAVASDVSSVGAGPSLHSGQVAFTGGAGAGASPTAQRGIYTWNAGTLSRIADRTTLIPGAPASRAFLNFSNPVIENGQVAFTGNNNGGVYRTGSVGLIRIADNNQTIPGTTIGFAVSGPAFSNGELAFRAAQFAYFKTENGQLVKIVDSNTKIPGTTATFAGFTRNPDIGNGQVVFTGTGNIASAGGGIYLGNGGNLATIVNQDTLIPGGRTPGASFQRTFGSPVIDHGQVAFFAATSSADNGVYLFDG
jgi:hypothetical protein